VGLSIVACVPCTLASAVLWTRMASGKEATALMTVLLTTSASWLITTAWLTWGAGKEVQLDAASLMQGLALVLIAPVGFVQLSRASSALGRFVSRFHMPLGIVAQLLVLSIVLKATVDVRDRIEGDHAGLSGSALWMTAVACLVTHLAGLGFGFGTGRLFRF